MAKIAATKITNATLKSLKPTGRAFQIRDVVRPGFGVQVSARGTINFFVRYQVDGKRRFLSLGTWGPTDLDAAQDKYDAVVGRVESGQDPAKLTRTKTTKKGLTLSGAFTDYQTIHDQLKPATVRDIQGALRNLGDWKTREMTSISAEEVIALHREIGQRSKTRANATMRWLRAVYNFSIDYHQTPTGAPVMTTNPVTKMSRLRLWYKPTRKTTYIKSHELKPWFKAVLALADVPDREPGTGKKNPKMKQGALSRDFLIFVLLTGLRRQEAAGLEWDRVDLKGRTVTIIDTKADRVHVLPMTPYLIGILKRRKKEGRGEFVFSNPRGDKLDNLRFTLDRVKKQSGITFSVHDLRRTFSTVADALDVPHYALKRLLNHSMAADVTAGYVVADVERLRAPMEKITNYFLKAGGLEPGADVVNLADRKAAQ